MVTQKLDVVKERSWQNSWLIVAIVQLVVKGLCVRATQATSLISVMRMTGLSVDSFGRYFLKHLSFLVDLESFW